MATHGQILCGTVTVPDIDLALRDYRDTLGLTLVETGEVPDALAASWDAAAVGGNRYALLQPGSGADCFIRLIQQRSRPDFVPTTSFGWAAYELTAQDAFGWPEKLAGSGFDLIGPPREIAGLPYFVAMQMLGPGREMIYLNEVRLDTPTTDLPKAASPADRIFIVILAAPDRQRAVEWYRDRLRLDEGETHNIEYTMINKAFGLPSGTQSTLTMIQQERMPIVEVDEYPATAKARISDQGALPPGNSMITLAADDLVALDLDWIVSPCRRDGPLYGGRLAGCVLGPAGELLELIETGR